jgi:hypothetical protein
MTLGSKEHDEILANFEKNFKGYRMDREKNPDLRKKGILYESGETNALCRAFIMGYSFGRSVYLHGS